MRRALYTASLFLALPWILARLWWRGAREPGYRAHVAERFGRYAGSGSRDVLWVHAVSVGEARAAEPLVRALQRAHPKARVLLTCMTAAGRQTIAERYGDTVAAAYLPYDLPGACRGFLEHFRPRLGVLMETEIWPNLLAACAEAGVPVMLANARLSDRSAQGYARFGALARPAFASLAAVGAQGEPAAERLRALGARGVEVCGNMKFDAEPDAAKLAEGRALKAALGGRRVLLLASTREGEEAMLLDALAGAGDAALIAVVPRHPRRFDEAARLLASRGETFARRSRGEIPRPGQRVFLGDTLGEMALYCALADVAVVGGGFAPLGGQNLIEACAAGVPVIAGPHMFNFAEATQAAVEAGAAVQARNAPQAAQWAIELLGDAGRRERMARAGLEFCAAHRGATARHLALCERLLRARAPG